MAENIKVTNSMLEVLGQGALGGFLRKEIPARLAYHLSLCIKKLQPELAALNDTRQAIIKKHAKLDERGEVETEKDNRTIKWQEGKSQKDVMDEMEDILKDEVELDLPKLKVDLDAIPLVALSDMTLLEPFIEPK